VRDSSVASYADPPTPLEPSAPTAVAAGAKGTPAALPLAKKPWQLLMPGEPFDPATAPKGATVRDQVSDWGTKQPTVPDQLCCAPLSLPTAACLPPFATQHDRCRGPS